MKATTYGLIVKADTCFLCSVIDVLCSSSELASVSCFSAQNVCFYLLAQVGRGVGLLLSACMRPLGFCFHNIIKLRT